MFIRSLIIALILVFHRPAVAQTYEDTIHPARTLCTESMGWHQYRGTLGTHKIGLVIGPGDSVHFTAHYFYFRHLHDIELEGIVTGNRDIVLRERDSAGRPFAEFHLRFAERDTARPWPHKLSWDVLVGEWSSDKGVLLPVRLEEHWWCYGDNLYSIAGATKSDADIEKNIQAFYFSVLKGDSETAARYVAYPLHIDSKRPHWIRNKQQFVKQYRFFITPALIADLKKDVPHDLFANADGIMIAYGVVWFNANGFVDSILPE